MNGANIRLLDTTLRDGEQAVGVIFSPREKRQIASLLASIGIPAIEAGFPALGPEEQACIMAVVDAELKTMNGQPLDVYAFARARRDDIRASADCGVNGVVISISTSESHIHRKFQHQKGWVVERVSEAAQEAASAGLKFTVSAEDASRTELAMLIEFFQHAEGLGAERVRYCDSLGIEDPYTTYKRIKYIDQEIGLPIDMHMHNDFGMATANALAGVRAGAGGVIGSIGGIGERTGNSPIEEVTMALKHLYDVDLEIDTARFREIAEYVAQASQRAIPIWKAIVGTNVFAHESGIHADGILKHPDSYEAFSPDEVGLERQIVIGKHSGSASVVHKFKKEFDIQLDNAAAQKLLEKVRAAAVELKRPLFTKELMMLYEETQNTSEPEAG